MDTEVLVWGDGHCAVAERSDSDQWFITDRGSYIWMGDGSTGELAHVYPTHWMPLPEPPEDQNAR